MKPPSNEGPPDPPSPSVRKSLTHGTVLRLDRLQASATADHT